MMHFIMENLTGILGLIFGSGSVLFWFLERKKYKEVVAGLRAENESKTLDNDIKILDMYKKELEYLGTRYEAKFKDVTGVYERKIKLLEEENTIKERIITSLKRENRDLKSRIKILEDENNSLK